MFQLFAESHRRRPDAIDAIRAALRSAGAQLVEVRPYTGHAVVIDVAVPTEGWVCFLATMSRPWDGFALDLRPECDEPPPAPEGGAITGTLHLTLMSEADEGGLMPPTPPAPAAAPGAPTASPR
jgi:hypothetical protein